MLSRIPRRAKLALPCLVLAVALRSCRHFLARKLGALTFLLACFTAAYALSNNILIGLAGAAIWFLVPWFELLTRIREELADILIYLVRLADKLGIDLEEAALEKIQTNAERYPVDKAHGKATKYTDL